jgi:hypothetical protein
MAGRKHALAKLHQEGDAASMKLAYLLGLPYTTSLIPTDCTFTPIDLVDASACVDQLVQRAVTNGPGVHEMEGVLDTIVGGIAELEGPKRFLPTIGVNAIEGDFGGGPGARMDWGNRVDLCLQAKWNLTEFITAHEKRQLAQSRLTQATLTFEDLKAKLTLGVQQTRAEILSGQQRIISAGDMVKHASETYRLSKVRFMDLPGNGFSDVIGAIRGLDRAHGDFLESIREYNKAQIRLMLLLGPSACNSAK